MSHRNSSRNLDQDDHRRNNHRKRHVDCRESDRKNDRHRKRAERSKTPEKRIKQEPREEPRFRHSNKKRRRDQPDDKTEYEWGRSTDNVKQEPNSDQPKAKPDFGLSGKLAEDTNTYNGVVIKYNEPPEARKAKRRWRLYPFKGETSLPFIPIHRQSAYLLGRERAVCDIPTDHPSCSKQHAVLQFRLINYERDDGTIGKRIRPYVIDLDSSNGTFVNNKQIETRRYVELIEQDVIKFGFSTREYVILHENSKGETDDDDDVPAEEVPAEEEPATTV